jgi:hypothetical protein
MAWNPTRSIAISLTAILGGTFSSILSGEGFDQMERGESPLEQFYYWCKRGSWIERGHSAEEWPHLADLSNSQ